MIVFGTTSVRLRYSNVFGTPIGKASTEVPSPVLLRYAGSSYYFARAEA